MTLQTYCLQGDKVLNVPSLFSRVDRTRPLYDSAVACQSFLFFYFVSQSGGSVTSLRVLLARQVLNWDFVQYVTFEFR